MVKASFYSRDSRLRNGATTSAPLHTWDWEHILATSSVKMDEDMFLDTLRILVTTQSKSIKYEFTEQMLGKPCIEYRYLAQPCSLCHSQFFHADDGDIVGLLCIARALEGGESDIVSSHHVWNTLQKERPDVAETLTKPIWYFDRKGETSVGEEPYIRTSVFYLETGPNPRVYSKWDPYYVKSLDRFMNAGIIPPLSPEQLEAAKVLEETCHRLRLHMILEVGDIQFLSNEHVLHARTEYIDHPPPAPRRHLMRLWLATPETEGGWKLPFHDSAEKKRGGIQVDNQPPVAPLDAE
jgi:hypothetical protein